VLERSSSEGRTSRVNKADGESAVDLPSVGQGVEVVETNFVPKYLINSIMPIRRVRN
jgi:hypothetical protein